MKLYTLHTSAPYEVARTVAIDIATKHGHAAYLTETKECADGKFVVDDENAKQIIDALKKAGGVGNYHKIQIIDSSRRWTTLQWWLVLIALGGAPVAFHYFPGLTRVQSYGIGWIIAVLVHGPWWEWRKRR